MKNYQLIIFFLVVFTIYFLGNAYIFFKGYNIIPRDNRLLYTIIFISLALTFIVAKFIESRHSSVFSDILNIAGGFWLGFMIYGFLFLLLSDIILLGIRIPGIIKSGNIPDYRRWAFLITLAASADPDHRRFYQCCHSCHKEI